jgi:serine/threonine protein kinase/Flp pilus assembly protein TadD
MIQTRPTEEEIFQIAREIRSSAARGAYLDHACGADAKLRERVLALLQIAEEEASFLERPPAAYVETIEGTRITERTGDVVGQYKLREQIGEGGFGVVYVAEQEKPVRRKVALKIIKPGMDTKDVIARFEAERQALALMDHPNVARVLDAGATESGRPYFVMELVQGVTITEFCDKNQLPTRKRLALFADVCRAVQHAHQKGIIHRDLKPSNIMVTLHDGQPVAKVIDFGVSKALSQQLTEKSIYTAYGQMIGTPAYMSPEQAEMSGLGIDTRSDIYSLGVLLYELLTGQTPLDAKRLRSSAYAEILRIIKEEEPPRPSLRISTLGEQATAIAQQRHTDVKQLRRDLAGELDWIVMKCLEKDRGRRYETANGLARDIEHYLKDEPVEACPPSAAYRLAKYWRKHRGLFSTAAAFAALLVLGAAVSGWMALRATLAERRAQIALASEQAARRDADAARQRAEWASKRLSTATQLANEGIEFSYRGNWAEALAKFAEAAKLEPDLATIYVYRRMIYTRIGLWDLAAADYAQTFRISKRQHWQTLFEHAALRHYVGDEAGYRAACQEMLRQYGNYSGNDVRMRLLDAACLTGEPILQRETLLLYAEELTSASDKWRLRSTAAIAFIRGGKYQRAIDLCDLILVPENNSPGGYHRINYAVKSLALHALGRKSEAQKALAKAESAIDDWTKEMVSGPVGTMPISWLDWLWTLAIYREAKTLITGFPPADDPRLAAVRQRALDVTRSDAHQFVAAGQKAIQQGNWDEAAAQFATAIDKLPDIAAGGLGQVHFVVEMVEQPEVFERLIRLRPDCLMLWSARGQVLANRREWSAAAADIDRAVGMLDETKRENPGAFFILNLCALRLLAGDEARYCELCADIVGQTGPKDHPDGASLLSRACSLSPTAAIDRAVPLRLARQAVASSPQRAWYQYVLGAALYRAGEYEQALAPLQESLRVEPNWLGRAQDYVFLAMAHHRLGRREAARDWLAKAQASFAELEQTIGRGKHGFAASVYLYDWLDLQILLPEAEKLLAAGEVP